MCGHTAQKMAKNDNLWYTYSPKGYIPLDDFYKILPGEGAPGLHPYAKLHRCGFKTVAIRHQKSPKMVIFGKNLPLRKKLWGSIGKFEHTGVGPQLQTFLYAMRP